MGTSMRWILGAVGALSLTACHLSAAPPDSSSIGTAVTGQNRWASQSVAWKDKNTGNSSYDGIAYGPGQAKPIVRNTLNNPDPSVDYVAPLQPGVDAPQVGEATKNPHEIPSPATPSDDYFVNGRDLGPSVDRAPGTGGPAKLSSPQP
jgi:hypothetical protein